jgi:CheY-like chemotaxis protein
MNDRYIHILLVEDNEGDILLIKEAFEEVGMQHQLNVVNDGEQALDYLHRKKPFETIEIPDIIVLDINLPKMNGHEVLHYIKNHTIFKAIPVIILTTSSSSKDIDKAYQNYVNSYITKPVDIHDFTNVVNGIEDYWLNLTKLPTKVHSK